MTDKKKRQQATRVRIIRPFKFAPIRVVRITQRSATDNCQSSSLKKNDTLEAEKAHVEGTLTKEPQDGLLLEKQKENSDAEQPVETDAPLAHFDSAANPYAFYVAQIPTMLCSLPSEAMSSVSNSDNDGTRSLTGESQNAQSDKQLDRPEPERVELNEQSQLEKHTYKSEFGMPHKDIKQARFGGQSGNKLSKELKHELNTAHSEDSTEQVNITAPLIAKKLKVSLGELAFWLSSPKEVLNTFIKADLNVVLPLLKQTSNIQSLTFAHLLHAYQQNVFTEVHAWSIEQMIARLIFKSAKEQISLNTLLALAVQAKGEDYAFVQFMYKGKSKSLFKPLSAFTQAGNLDELKDSAPNHLFYVPCTLSFEYLNECLAAHQQRWQTWLRQPLVKRVI
ncbi:hypothetical protein [Pseudoalteromonas phenolica]|uniref:hypothetical protein n=1 Tax=Pseudoalteromonas phenolica TaxID=161398 RepID=UPI00110AA49B|nr:hypothetical protein [Pseudoalteromonas phenolica]TMO57297.1 hypothetical protein CWC21_05300 [Pseudoalteromonas phenolica]